MTKYSTLLATTSILLAAAAAPAMAKPDESDRIEALEGRIAELESSTGGDTPLNFGIGNTRVSIYGFARAEAFYDFDFQQGDLTNTPAIGEPGIATDGAFDTSVRVSRFGIRSATETDIGTIGTQLEFDLFGSDTGGSSPNLRLRHANVRIGDAWLIGQFWTNFMPLVHYPRTADFNGPVGITFARQPQLRYTGKASDALTYSFSIEESNGLSDDPVLTAAAFYQQERWSARIAGLVGRAQQADDESIEDNIQGVTLSGSVTPWEGGSITGTYVTGDGIGGLLIGGGDEIVNGEANGADGFTIEVRHQLTDSWNIGASYGSEDYDLPTSTGTLDFTELETLHVNAFYEPVDNLTIGLEYIMGERTTSTGETFDADRIGASVTFSF